MTGAYHAAHLTEEPARAVVWRAVARHLASWVPADAEVLEIGAGYAHWINNVQARRRVAVDIWPELPQRVAPGVEPRVLDVARDLRSLGEAAFDVVLASNLLEHFNPDLAAAIVADVASVLRPGGRFIVIQPNFALAWRRYFDDYTHRAIFTAESLPALLRAQGFRIDLVKPRFLPYSLRGARLPVTSWLVAAYLRSPFKPMAGQMLVVARRDRVDVR